MKTLRNHWLDRHQHLDSRLDTARANALRQALATSAPIVPARTGKTWGRRMLRRLWQELFIPCRPVWATLAVTWVLLLLFNSTLRLSGSLPEYARGQDGKTATAPGTATSQDLAFALAGWMEQRRQIAALVQTDAALSLSSSFLSSPSPDEFFFAPGHCPASEQPSRSPSPPPPSSTSSPEHSQWRPAVPRSQHGTIPLC
ncbi:MAG: hypothetical protein LBK99_20745 [Opitutaceae bacterium]|jgi:hypothetical protein|nr:hypothetical protein [Opitutaceae bacterium]